MNISIPNISKLYTCNDKTRIRTVLLSNNLLKLYNLKINNLISLLGEGVTDDIWKNLLRKLKTFRFELYASLLTKEYIEEQLRIINQELERAIDISPAIFPEATEVLREILGVIQQLPQSNLDVQLQGILEIIQENRDAKIAILIKEPKLVDQTERVILPNANLVILTPPLLREINCYDVLIVLGPPRWYPEYVFTAPRSKDIVIFQFKWIRDNWRPVDIFADPIKQQKRSQDYIYEEPAQDQFDPDAVTPNSFLPPEIDIDVISHKVDTETRDRLDYVEARLYLLENGWSVFLEADENSSVNVIDFEFGSDPIRRIKNRELEIGLFLLLRTSGGGDYVIPVANRILGAEYEIAREYQKEWKKLLRTIVRRDGHQKTINELKKLGSSRANLMNLHNWMSERSICTDDIEDYSAVMRLINLEKYIQVYWETMKKIDRAHRLAGQQIRRMLLDEVKKTSISELKKIGIFEFTIPGENVSITAFRINRINEKVNRVMPWRIGYPIEPE